MFIIPVGFRFLNLVVVVSLLRTFFVGGSQFSQELFLLSLVILVPYLGHIEFFVGCHRRILFCVL